MNRKKCNALSMAIVAMAVGWLSPADTAYASGVPTEWTVRIGPRSVSYQVERRHGDALDLRATLTYNGQPLAYTGPARLYAQTNGMGSVWWDLAPCTVVSNTLQATWLPSFDTGADVVDLFLGGPSNYQAAARIRFLPSPGSVPNSLPLPAPTLDFSTVQILNPPYYTRQETDSAIESAAPGDYSTVSNRAMSAIQKHQSLEPSTNYTDRTLGAFAETGSVYRATTYGTPTRWTDATGCVWEVVTNPPWTQVEGPPGYSITWYDDSNAFIISTYYDGEGWYVSRGDHYPEKAASEHSATNAACYTKPVGGGATIDYVRYVRQAPGLTNLVGRVSLTNDLPGAISSTISDFAATGTVHAAESAMSATWAGRLSSGGSVGADNVTYEGILAGFAASSNYTDAVAAEFSDGTRTVSYSGYSDTSGFASSAGSLIGDGITYNVASLILESTNAAIAVAASKQDALPYPTNAIPYAAISGAPSGEQEWRVETQSSYNVHYVTNGMADVSMDAELSCSTNGWPNGASMFARFTIGAGISYMLMDDRIRLVGYGTWPTNSFQSVWWRSGTKIYVNVILEE